MRSGVWAKPPRSDGGQRRWVLGKSRISSQEREKMSKEGTEDSGDFDKRQCPQRAQQKGVLWHRGVQRTGSE